MKEPEVYFKGWKNWELRESPYEDFDVPRDFGCLGIYLLASPMPPIEECHHIQKEVIYIGMSTNTTDRLYRHSIVKDYKKTFNVNDTQNLYFAEWKSEWTNFGGIENLSCERACLQYIERKLIWDFVKTHGKLPLLNKT